MPQPTLLVFNSIQKYFATWICVAEDCNLFLNCTTPLGSMDSLGLVSVSSAFGCKGK